MPTSNPNPIRLRFGAELEVSTGSKTNAHMEWYLTANELSEELGTSHVKNHWSVTQEVTITNQMMQNKWGMELVSPILDFQDQTTWQWHMDAVWWVLATKFNTSATRQCSTHVHISPSQGSWTLEQVKKVAKAILYYERSIDSLLPLDRRQSPWAQSNRHNVLLSPQTMITLFAWIDGAETIPYIAFLMCAYSKDSQYGKVMGYRQDFAHNVFQWNFTPLAQGSRGTIEFRQHPGSTGAAASKLWISFAASFVHGAILYADRLDATTPPNLQAFRSFLINGAVQSGVADYSALDGLFSGKTQLPPSAHNLVEKSSQDLTHMKEKAAESNITIEKFKKLYGYR